MVKEKHLTSDYACKFSRFSMGLEKKKKRIERERQRKVSSVGNAIVY